MQLLFIDFQQKLQNNTNKIMLTKNVTVIKNNFYYIFIYIIILCYIIYFILFIINNPFSTLSSKIHFLHDINFVKKLLYFRLRIV